jgi:MFS family permease
MLAPFRVRGFRFQWGGDLAMSWAAEMEILILGWYVLVESGSVSMLALFAALQYAGSLVSPLFGVAGDRLGYARLFWGTRALYGLLAAIVLVMAWIDTLSPAAVLIVASLAGMVRPSDMVMRYAVIARVLPANQLMGGLGIARITSDSARIAGALAGAGTVAAFGMVWAYVAIVLLYTLSFLLTMGIEPPNRPPKAEKATDAVERANVGTAAALADRDRSEAWVAREHTRSPLKDLRSAFAYVWGKPVLRSAFGLAFLVNLLAFPLFLGLLPYVARQQYGLGQEGLSTLAASFASGGLLGSILVGSNRLPLGAARTMIVAAMVWFSADVLFAFNHNLGLGVVLLITAGLASSVCLTPLAAVMLRGTDPDFRGRVMGMRMLAIWGLPLGLLCSGPLIEAHGFTLTALFYSVSGLVLCLAIALYWREHLWSTTAMANA